MSWSLHHDSKRCRRPWLGLSCGPNAWRYLLVAMMFVCQEDPIKVPMIAKIITKIKKVDLPKELSPANMLHCARCLAKNLFKEVKEKSEYMRCLVYAHFYTNAIFKNDEKTFNLQNLLAEKNADSHRTTRRCEKNSRQG